MYDADRNGNSPLHFAVMFDSPFLLQLLVRMHYDPRCTNALGQTPRDLAIQRGKLRAATALEHMESELYIRDCARRSNVEEDGG
jgi:ankyrin repeat protein